VAFNSPAMAVTGGTSPYTFTVVGTLPAGLTLNASTGAINGTPTASGTFSIKVTDAKGVVAIGSNCPFTISQPTPPSFKLEKSANLESVLPGNPVTYSYTVTNTGGTTLTNIKIVDDNGTPTITADDFTVGTIASLAPGALQTLTAIKTLVQPVCMIINGQSVVVGLLYTTVLSSGDIQVKYVQQNVNDNRYGTGATAATGWSRTQNFSNLTGSDKAEFKFTDGKGNIVLDFFVDYITASNSFPSGYGSLGPFGGDGSWVTGNQAYLLSYTSSLAENFNKTGSPFKTGYFINSPAETAPLSGISIPAGWDYDNSYTVVVSKSAFGTNGFGGVTIPAVHDSPPKIGSSNLITPEPCNSCIVNTAKATATAGTTTLTTTDTAQVCFSIPPINVAVGAIKFTKNKINVTLTNNGTTTATFDTIKLSNWPATNGTFQKVVNGSAVVWDGLDISTPPATLTGLANNTIPPGGSITLTFQFHNNVSTTASGYALSLAFGTSTVTVF
jgi:hypothetical protein